MHVLKDDIIDPSDDLEFLKRLQNEGYIQNAAASEKPENVYDELKRRLGRQRQATGQYLSKVKEGIDALASVNTQLVARKAIARSPALQFTETAADAFFSRLTGNPVTHKSIDDLFDEEVSIIKGLSTALGEALSYSGKIRDGVIEYRDERVLEVRQQAFSDYAHAEQKARKLFEFSKDLEERLAKTKVTDPNYAALYKAHGILDRNMMDVYNTLSKCRQTMVLRTDELDQLTTQIEIMEYVVLRIDSVNDYVANVIENVEHTIESYRFIRQCSENIGGLNIALNQLTRCVMTATGEMGEQIADIARMTTAETSEGTMPRVVGRMMNGYKATLFEADSKTRSAFDSRAEQIMNGYGLG